MINVTLKGDNQRTTPEVPQYPRLMLSTTGNKRIVLMLQDKCGVVLDNGISHFHENGYYDTGWAMGSFADYHGTIELSNANE